MPVPDEQNVVPGTPGTQKAAPPPTPKTTTSPSPHIQALEETRKALTELQQEYERGRIDLEPLIQRLQSWEAHLKHADSYRLRRNIFRELVFKKSCYGNEG